MRCVSAVARRAARQARFASEGAAGAGPRIINMDEAMSLDHSADPASFNSAAATITGPNSEMAGIAADDAVKQSVAEKLAELGVDPLTLSADELRALEIEHGLFDYDHGSIITGVHDLLGFVHETSGLPWWASVIGLSVLVRAPGIALFMRAQKYQPKMREWQQHFQKLQSRMTTSKSMADRVTAQQDMMEHFKARPPLLPVLGNLVYTMATSMPMFVGLRSLWERFPSLSEGGFSWITDLTMPDPYFAVPVSFALASSAYTAFMQRQMVSQQQMNSTVQNNPLVKLLSSKKGKWLIRGLPFIFLPVVAQQDALMPLYFASTLSMQVCASLVASKLYPPPPPTESAEDKPNVQQEELDLSQLKTTSLSEMLKNAELTQKRAKQDEEELRELLEKRALQQHGVPLAELSTRKTRNLRKNLLSDLRAQSAANRAAVGEAI
ncbi:MAG: hypothetical protein MHM6MM_002894 [Cercozoa sp. M6MM]